MLLEIWIISSTFLLTTGRYRSAFLSPWLFFIIVSILPNLTLILGEVVNNRRTAILEHIEYGRWEYCLGTVVSKCHSLWFKQAGCAKLSYSILVWFFLRSPWRRIFHGAAISGWRPSLRLSSPCGLWESPGTGTRSVI